MPRKPKPQIPPTHHRITLHLWGVFRRNPYTSIAALVTVFIGIPSAVTAASFLSSTLEPMWPATHRWVKEFAAPIIQVQATQQVGYDRFLLFQQQQALSAIQKDPALAASPTVQDRLRDMQGQIADTKGRLCKATAKSQDCQ